MTHRPRLSFACFIAGVLTIALSLTVGPQPGRAAVVAVVDQEQSGIQPISGGNTIGGPSNQKIAQVVEVGVAGDLMMVELPVECLGASTLSVEIQNVLTIPGPLTMPSGTVLASVTHTPSDLPEADADGFRLFMFGTTLPFAVKDRFAIVMSATGAGALDSCFIRHAPAGDTYPKGDGWFVNDEQVSPWNPGGWLCMCDAGAGAAFDNPFRTYMQVPPPPSTPTPATPEADISITKTLHDVDNPGATNFFADLTMVYLLTVTNGGATDATNVSVVDTLPANITVIHVSPGCVLSASTVTCTESQLAAGDTISFGIVFSFKNAGTYTNTASVSATESDPDTSNNTATVMTQVYPTADLQFTQITPSAVVLSPGDPLTHVVQFTNKGPDPAGDVLLLHTLPAGTQFVSISSPDTIFCGQNVGDEYGCRFNGGIPVGATRSMTITVNAPTSAQGVLSTFALSHVQAAGALIYDHPVHSSWDMVAWVVSETAQGSPPADGTITTDLEGDGATNDDPIETSVTTPNAGAVTITEQETTGSASTSWTLLGAEVVISAPAGSASDPIGITFRIEDDLLLGEDPMNVQVFRNYSTSPVGDCAQSGTPSLPVIPISPDPCVAMRTVLADGDLEIVVLTSQASVWSFATRDPLSFGGFQEPVRDVNPANAGRAIPLKFSLDGFQGMDVLVTGTPSSRTVPCDGDTSSETLETADLVGGGLRYDETTNTYSVRWDTDPAWAGTCRELVLQLADGSEHTVLFQFK
jgi:uncharacterized repeat protein (TIGR01451 family)